MDVLNFCRLCGKDNQINYKNIFEKSNNGQQFIQIIIKYIPILIYRTDPLSKKICSNCYQSLENYFDFLQNCISVQDNFKIKLTEHENDDNVQLYLNTLENHKAEYHQNITPHHETKEISTQTDLILETSPVPSENFNTPSIPVSPSQSPPGSPTRSLNGSPGVSPEGSPTHSPNGSPTHSPDGSPTHSPDGSPANSPNGSPTHSPVGSPTHSPNGSPNGSRSNSPIRDSLNESRPLKRKFTILTPELINSGLNPNLNPNEKRVKLSVVSGPRCKTKPHLNFNPKTLLQSALHVINMGIDPNYLREESLEEREERYYQQEVDRRIFNEALRLREQNFSRLMNNIDFEAPVNCNYCFRGFPNILELSRHEIGHMLVDAGPKCDSKKYRSRFKQFYNMYLRGQSSAITTENGIEILEEVSTENSFMNDLSTDSVFELKNEEIFINGKPLLSYDKNERKQYFKSIYVNGIKKKFCPICRHTFKDNWAIDWHYTNNSCQYTCKFCGLKFKYHKELFPEHLKIHEGQPCNKIFGPTDKKAMKKKKIKVIKRSKIFTDPNLGYDRPKIQPIKLKTLLEQKSMEYNHKTGYLDQKPPNSSQFSAFLEYTTKISEFLTQNPEFLTQNPALVQNPEFLVENPEFLNQNPDLAQNQEILNKISEFLTQNPEFLTHNREFLARNPQFLPRNPEFADPEHNAQFLNIKKERGDISSEILDSSENPNYQAYFCRKCFKVFFKIDEFNFHTSTCTGVKPSSESETSEVVDSKRPVRHCRDFALYNDSDSESFGSNSMRNSPNLDEKNGPQSYECGVCSSSFPTRHSRNSHMRIHKSQKIPADKVTNYLQKNMTMNRQESVQKQVQNANLIKKLNSEIPSQNGAPLRLGTLNPIVAKLVQNNPNLTIRSYQKNDEISPKNPPKLHNTPKTQPPLRNQPSPKFHVSPKFHELSPKFYNSTPQKLPNESSHVPNMSHPISNQYWAFNPQNSNHEVMLQNPPKMGYRCGDCGGRFENKSLLYYHKMNNCIVKRIFECAFCHKKFGSQDHYNLHMLHVHPE